MEFTIRAGRPDDHQAAEFLTREAFWNLYRPGCDEHFLLNQLWSHPDFIPELFYVAEAGQDIVGLIVFTVSHIESESGVIVKTATFGPVCVLPKYQHHGIGAGLIQTGLKAAAGLGFPAVIILGDPHNYCRHGFINCRDFGIADLTGRYPLGQLIHVFDAHALQGATWQFTYSGAYNLDESAAKLFDANFPEKALETKPSQELFGMLIRSYLD